MRGSFTARLNLRLSEDTFDAFKGAADAIGIDTTSLARQCLDASAPAMRAVEQSVGEMKEGRVAQGVGLFAALVEATVQQGEVSRRQVKIMIDQAQDHEQQAKQETKTV